MTPEQIPAIGYLNADYAHALVSIHYPPMVNPGENFIQIALTIEGALKLRAALNVFLDAHGVVWQ